MEAHAIAGVTTGGVAEGVKTRRFEQQCERLRPLGHAFVLRRFQGQLTPEDAEDAVSEVIVRLHEHHRDGGAPRNLRAAFFTSVRNQAIDMLRARGARPSEVALEAAAQAAGEEGEPAERAESREEAAALSEALARMRPNYREAIVLRFGVGLTVPEIAEHRGISLPAAKKLVLKATRQVKERLLTVTSPEHCGEMQELAKRSLFEKCAAEIATEEERALVEKHLEHCGSCKAFLVDLHRGLHELATGALLASGAAGQLTGKAGVGEHVSHVLGGAGDAPQALVEKARMAAFKAGNAFQGADGAGGGVLAGTGQKVVAVCGAGAAATCIATGAVAPTAIVGQDKQPVKDQPAKVQAAPEPESVAESAPAPAAAAPVVVAPAPAQPAPAPAPKEFAVEAAAGGGGGKQKSSGGEFGVGGGGGGGASGGGGGGSGGGEFGIP